MADTPIYWPDGSKTRWMWGDRHYYYNCHRDGGDYAWFKDNLETAASAPNAKEITATWTFDGRWDPEETMPSVLPTVFLPRPRDGASQVQRGSVNLKWVSSRNAQSHKIYFGTSSNPEFKKDQKNNSFHVNNLAPKTTYYWRIDEVNDTEIVHGPLWQFTTE
jgi:hypothetical protein